MAHAIRVEATGGPEVLQWTEIDDPGPRDGEIGVDVHAAGVNFIDTYHRSGLYEVPLPFIPGSEGAGTIVGSAEPVAWVGAPSSYATRVVVRREQALPVPESIDLDVAAALPLQGMTAHYLACDTYPLSPGDRCLIHAAAGGTGRLLVQIAKIRGGEVVATAGTAEKLDLARAAGADHVINYCDEDLVEAVTDAVGPNSIDVVYDGVGAATFDAGLAVLRPRGTMVTFGNASGPVPPIAPLRLMPKSLFLTRPTLASHIADTTALRARWDDLVGWVVAGRLDVRIGLRLPLDRASEAHTALENRATTGKILLTT